MNEKLVKISLFGELGNVFGKSYSLSVSSVSEAIHALNILNKQQFYTFLINNDKIGMRYQVLINGKLFEPQSNMSDESCLEKQETVESIRHSDLTITYDDLRTIDIVPVVAGANGIFTAILGALLIVVGAFTGLGVLVVVGIALLAGGIINLLMRPPKFEDFREISGGGRTSYLFNGPQNTTREGGPVPLGYGRLIVGSQVISASYVNTNISANAADVRSTATNPGSIDLGDWIKNQQSIYRNFIPASPMYSFSLNAKPSIVLESVVSTNNTITAYYAGTIDDVFLTKNNTNPVGSVNDVLGVARINNLGTDGFDGVVLTKGTSDKPIVYTASNRKYLTTPGSVHVIGGDFTSSTTTFRFGQPVTTTYNGIMFFIPSTSTQNKPVMYSVSKGSGFGKILGSYIDSSSNIFVCGDFSSIGGAGGTASRTYIAKYTASNASYSVDATLNPTINDIVRCITTDSTGKIYIGGDFTTVNATTRNRIAKLSSLGVLDGTFASVSIDNGSVFDIKVDEGQSKIYVVGNFTSVNSSSTYKYIIRLNSDGTIDSGFSQPSFTGTNISINSIYIGVNGRIYIAGRFETVSSSGSDPYSSKALCRLLSDGTIDSEFISRFDANEDVTLYKVSVRDKSFGELDGAETPDGKLFIAGDFKNYDGYNYPNFIRINNPDYLEA